MNNEEKDSMFCVHMGLGVYVTMNEYKEFCDAHQYGCAWPPNPKSVIDGKTLLTAPSVPKAQAVKTKREMIRAT